MTDYRELFSLAAEEEEHTEVGGTILLPHYTALCGYWS